MPVTGTTVGGLPLASTDSLFLVVLAPHKPAGLTAVSTAPGDPQTSHMLTTAEVARLLRIDPSSVRRWRAERPPQGPPFIRLSERVVLYDTHDLRDWLHARRTTPDTRRQAA